MMKLLVTIITLLSFHTAGMAQTWTRCSEGLPAAYILSLTKCQGTLFAGTDKQGIYRSDDNAATWTLTPLHPNFLSSQSGSLATIDTFIFVGQRGHGVFRTSLHDTVWTKMNNGGIVSKVIQDLIAVGNTLYAASYGGGVYTSSDLGNSWTVVNANNGMNDPHCFSLTANEDFLFTGTAGTNSSLDTGVAFRTPLLSGMAWTKIDSGFVPNGAHLEGVFSMDAGNGFVFAGTDDVGIFRSADNGSHWIPMGTYNGDIHAIKIVDNKVFYGTTYSGVYTSSDSGVTFFPNNVGLALGNMTLPFLVKDFYTDAATQQIYAATDIGVFRQPVAISTGIEAPLRTAFAVNVYPNPASGLLQIHAEHEVLSYTLCSVNGIEVLSGTPLRNEFTLNLTGLPDGVYFIGLFDGTGNVYSKIILSR